MKHYLVILFCFICIEFSAQVKTEQSNELSFQGQAVSWMHYNPDNPYPLYLGARFIPQLNYEIQLPKNGLLDFEASANLVGDVGWHIPDSANWNGKMSPYRLWGRYSTEQFELRVGLQKINFGSASLLRPLMWFDQVDPRDPLQLTDGVYGALTRYYFLNNANLWVWVLYGNDNLKGWEVIPSNSRAPEFGGRLQLPFSIGEAAIAYHHRKADSRNLNSNVPMYESIPENRLGFDARFDKVIGFWCEGAWVHMGEDIGVLTNQQTVNVGLDYTFNIGNGIGVIAEHLLSAYDQTAFTFDNPINTTAMSINYPIGMFDNLSGIVFYNWNDKQLYNFINWTKQYDAIALNVMAYWNPDDYAMPLQANAENLFGGKGIQLMLVYNF